MKEHRDIRGARHVANLKLIEKTYLQPKIGFAMVIVCAGIFAQPGKAVPPVRKTWG
jgi:hypothetical protein